MSIRYETVKRWSYNSKLPAETRVFDGWTLNVMVRALDHVILPLTFSKDEALTASTTLSQYIRDHEEELKIHEIEFLTKFSQLLRRSEGLTGRTV